MGEGCIRGTAMEGVGIVAASVSLWFISSTRASRVMVGSRASFTSWSKGGQGLHQ